MIDLLELLVILVAIAMAPTMIAGLFGINLPDLSYVYRFLFTVVIGVLGVIWYIVKRVFFFAWEPTEEERPRLLRYVAFSAREPDADLNDEPDEPEPERTSEPLNFGVETPNDERTEVRSRSEITGAPDPVFVALAKVHVELKIPKNDLLRAIGVKPGGSKAYKDASSQFDDAVKSNTVKFRPVEGVDYAA
jgi:hypothetical protein